METSSAPGTPDKVVAPLTESACTHRASPEKVVCVAINYAGLDGFSPDMDEALVFVKPGNSVTDPDSVTRTPLSEVAVVGEAELALVISRMAKRDRQ
jgi:2-keto-4-pentenoate hydratase/2-oxohepta-3-ene-1,7-dioic acid hydratase in catechol pathway